MKCCNIPDIDECREGTSGCDGNANCTNSEGSFTCNCTIGYSGDGFMCAGNYCIRQLKL